MDGIAGGLPGALAMAGGVLLDFDGVLVDSEPFYLASWRAVLEGLGDSVEDEEYYTHWTSLGEGLDGHLARHGLSGVDTAAARAAQREIYLSYCESGAIPVMPGTADALAGLASGRFRDRHAIASNTDPQIVGRILSRAGIPAPRVVGGREYRPKPAPDIFLAAARAIGVDPRSCLVLEDAWKGLEAAREAGMKTVLVRNELNRGAALEADFEMRGIADLAGLLG